MARHAPRLLCFLWAVLLASSCSSSLHSVSDDGREVIRVERGPEGMVWVVQLTDLHISSYHPDRAASLRRLMGPLLALINPSLVLITGDLTDAKNKDLTVRRQDEKEWVQYKQAISKVIAESGLPAYAFFDLRGNHDKFGVPLAGGRLDYFSKYSISALRNRTNNVQSVTLKSSGWKHLFVGVDTSMSVGLKGPCNLFGHPTDEQLVKMDLELSQWDTCPPEKVTKVVFGHFPMSFTSSTEHGSRPDYVFAKHSIAAYVCGHLHKSFGPNLIDHHFHLKGKSAVSPICGGAGEDGIGEFWEWELGDWRMRRTLRVIAIDQGHTSFVDFDMSALNASDHGKDWLPTFVVPTYPLDSQRMERLELLPHSMTIQDVVRALVFSPQPLVSVVAKVYDTISGKPHLLEELKMHSIVEPDNMGYLYEAPWQSMKYIDASATRYVYQVSAVDSTGKVTESSLRAFSVERRVSELKKTWREYLVMGFVWEEAYKVLVRLAFASLFVLFILPKFFLHFLLGNGCYERWSYGLFRIGNQKPMAQRFLKLFVWFFLQGCAHNVLWCEQLFVVVWLICFPWYWGQVLADGYSLGFMSLRGWEVRLSKMSPPLRGLGWPDLMVIVLPYLYFVVLPLYILIFALSAEASLHEIYQMEMPAGLKKKEKVVGEMKSLLSCDGGEDTQNEVEIKHPLKHSRTSCRWVRLLMMGCCLIVSFIHFGQVCAIAGAHGYMVVFASPGFAWPVPVLMISALLKFSACRKQKD